MVVSLYLDIGLTVLGSLVALTDISRFRIPNLLLFIGFCGAIVIHFFSATPFTALLWALVGCVIGLLIFLPLYYWRGMAAGDLKFMATVGAFSTPVETIYIALIAVCLGGVISLFVICINGKLRTLVENLLALMLMWLVRTPADVSVKASSVGRIPYGVAITFSSWIVIAQHYN